MIIKHYIVNTMNEAMTRIRYELGTEAVIISQRKVRKPGIKGFFSRKIIEVTAAVENEVLNDEKQNKVNDNTLNDNTVNSNVLNNDNRNNNSNQNDNNQHNNELNNIELNSIKAIKKVVEHENANIDNSRVVQRQDSLVPKKLIKMRNK